MIVGKCLRQEEEKSPCHVNDQVVVLSSRYYIVEGSLFGHKSIIPPHSLSCVKLLFITTNLYPTWKVHSNTCKNEIMEPSTVVVSKCSRIGIDR